MKNKRIVGLTIGLCLFSGTQAHSAPFSVLIGDKDNFGFGNVDANLPSFNFDNRTSIDPSFTDVVFPAFSGPGLNVLHGEYTFNFSPPSSPLSDVTLDIHFHGLQSIFPGKILRFDGNILSFNLDNIEQGALGHGIVSIPIENTLFPYIMDGNVTVQFANTNPLNPDSIAIDWLQLNANPVPIPGAIWLLGSGVAVVAALRNRRK